MNDRARTALARMRRSARLAIDYAGRDPAWTENEMVLDAVAKRVEHLAEIAKYQFPRELRREAPGIEWDQIAGMRDRLVHDYDRIDREILRQVVDDDLPRLKSAIDKLLPEEG